VRAILRRASNRPARAGAADEIIVGPIVLHAGMHQVRVADRAVALTGAEFRVLEILMRSAGQVISRDSMTEQALGRKLVPYDRSIDTHISNIRRKLAAVAVTDEVSIVNVRRTGYVFTVADTPAVR
jgi:DNA-binding response OmpR family regulator